VREKRSHIVKEVNRTTRISMAQALFHPNFNDDVIATNPNARIMLPPPGVHPNNAVFSSMLPKPLTWQRREHSIQRRNILGHIGRLLNGNTQSAGIPPGILGFENAQLKIWTLARKLEVLIFINSASLLEYSNVNSLPRRVQALTATIVNKQIRKKQLIHSSGGAFSPCVPPSQAILLNDRCVTGSQIVNSTSAQKARESENFENKNSTSIHSKRPNAKRKRTSDLSTLLFRGFDDLSKVIWSFLDGIQIMKCRGVNKASRALMPLFVTNLQMSCNTIQAALATRPGAGTFSILCDCVNLRYLEVVSLASGMTFGKLSMRAMNCPQRFVVTHADHEEIVTSLSEQLRFGGFPKLTRLGITCLFTNEEANGEADVLLNNLMLKCCPDLEELCLPGNSFGDYGACKIAELLRSGVCPKLSRLDLRKNFIGECGIRAICEALVEGCASNLTELCLGGNTITDSSFLHVIGAIQSGKLEKLKFLGIEMNYLTEASMQLLGLTIGKLYCPLLSQISYSNNSIDDVHAKRIIANAVYQERVRHVRKLEMDPYQQCEKSDID
jgi:hypothetical protein